MIENVDRKIIDDIGYFFNKVNEKALYSLGHTDYYDHGSDEALKLEVEYFHPQITLDDRMVYIMKNIVTSGESYRNIICNTIVSHFYGARGIHQIITRDNNPKTALVDFERLLVDYEYRNICSKNLEDAKKLNLPIYGSTELRTSLFGAANNYVAKKYNKEKDNHPINILLWVAGFIERGIVDKMYGVSSLKEMYSTLITLEGVGSYYGYHCSTSNSVNPNIHINHDERFCVPGPGARLTLDMMFGKDCKIPYGDRVIWFRENYKDLIGEIDLHPSTHNVIVNGKKILKEDQNELKTYGCEVGLCQFGVYTRLKNNPQLINRRKVARLDESVMNQFFDPILINKKTNNKKEMENILELFKKNKEKSIVKSFKEEIKPAPSVDKNIKKKPKYVVNVNNYNTIVNLIEELGKNSFTHNALSKLIESKGGLGLKQDSTWKESWVILQKMVEQGKLIKQKGTYIKKY